jgi:hypothetical protein
LKSYDRQIVVINDAELDFERHARVAGLILGNGDQNPERSRRAWPTP